jgi:hypothetical protein
MVVVLGLCSATFLATLRKRFWSLISNRWRPNANAMSRDRPKLQLQINPNNTRTKPALGK